MLPGSGAQDVYRMTGRLYIYSLLRSVTSQPDFAFGFWAAINLNLMNMCFIIY